jgi:hypothetical protein
MILAPTLTLNALRGPSVDPDAAAFAAASGATDVAALSAFVKGVKDLGLWDDMVCWPLRSTQNAGTGTTAYSLGGLGTFNGTLVNGPTWGTDEISFVRANDQYIDTNLFIPSGPVQLAACYAVAPVGGNNTILSTNNAATERQLLLMAHGSAPNAARASADIGAGFIEVFTIADPIPNTGTTARQVVQFSHGSNTFTGARNAETPTTIAGTGTVVARNISVRIAAFGATFTQSFNGGISFALVATATQNPAQLYNLYKQTLGTGLSLP